MIMIEVCWKLNAERVKVYYQHNVIEFLQTTRHYSVNKIYLKIYLPFWSLQSLRKVVREAENIEGKEQVSKLRTTSEGLTRHTKAGRVCSGFEQDRWGGLDGNMPFDQDQMEVRESAWGRRGTAFQSQQPSPESRGPDALLPQGGGVCWNRSLKRVL